MELHQLHTDGALAFGTTRTRLDCCTATGGPGPRRTPRRDQEGAWGGGKAGRSPASLHLAFRTALRTRPLLSSLAAARCQAQPAHEG